MNFSSASADGATCASSIAQCQTAASLSYSRVDDSSPSSAGLDGRPRTRCPISCRYEIGQLGP